MLRSSLPLLLLGLALPLRAQNVVLDEGTFRLERNGREIGTETFTIRRVGQGAEAHVIANAVIELDLAAGHEQVKPLLRAAPDLSVAAYQLQVSGREPTDIAVTLNGRRFVARTRTPSGEQEREYRAAPGAVLLEQDVAHQYWFLSQLPEGTDVSVLVPRAGTQNHVVVRAARAESLDLPGGAVQARHVTFEIDKDVHEVWYDADGRVLKVSVPATGFVAERTAR
jgi:hypothetical protein